MTIIVNKDGSGSASDPADLDVRLAVVGIPSEYTYSAGSGT